MSEKTVCPCGSKKEYKECCEPVIKGKNPAKTAEALMRARYSSYAKHEIDFIVASCLNNDKDSEIDHEETRKWSEKSDWLGLSILRTEKGQENDTTGIVEFTATYSQKGLKEVHKEKANFEKKDGQWYYTYGTITPTTVVREGTKVGRNDPCPCASGKKYKQCCGR